MGTLVDLSIIIEFCLENLSILNSAFNTISIMWSKDGGKNYLRLTLQIYIESLFLLKIYYFFIIYFIYFCFMLCFVIYSFNIIIIIFLLFQNELYLWY